MSPEGLRAWIGEVERKLGKRTRVFLALAVIAIGIGGGAIYLAIDARESSVSESDVQALQEDLEARIGAGGTAGTSVTQLEAELEALRAELSELKGESGGSPQGGGSGKQGGGSGAGGDSSGGGASSGGASSGGAGSVPGGAAGSAKLRELLERAKERAEENE